MVDVAALASLLSKRRPTVPVARTTIHPRELLYAWLDLLTPPEAAASFQWSDSVVDFSAAGDSAPEWAKEHNILLSVQLPMNSGKYLLLIKEAQASENRKVYIISISTERSEEELKAHRMVSQTYAVASESAEERELEPVKTIWAENFQLSDMANALFRAATVMLGRELDMAKLTKALPTIEGVTGSSGLDPDSTSEQELTDQQILEGWKKLSAEQRANMLHAIGQTLTPESDEESTDGDAPDDGPV